MKDDSEPDHYGQSTAQLIDDAFNSGIDRGVLLMRHSARTFDPDIHDLMNPLTDHGRWLCDELGKAVPKDVALKGYASPPERCMETATRIIAAHSDSGGPGHRTRPVEALGVFYALDQQKMWKGLQLADSLAAYVGQWFEGNVPADAMIPAPQAVELIVRVMREKLQASGAERQLDLCVTHDMTVYTVRHGVGLESVEGPDVEFLDGLLLFERSGGLYLRSHHGGEVQLD